jgi:hypothetical protein
MGSYFRYVNYTRRECVGLSDLRDGGDKENAALYCGPALAWLLLWPPVCGDGYRGRWHRPDGADDVRIVSDGAHDFGDMDDAGFLNITPGLLQSMRTAVPAFVEDYHPRHEITIVQRVKAPHLVEIYEVANPCRASCSCGWAPRPVYGEDRERVLELCVSTHVNGQDA